jgi:two-component system, chemotaxis family, sensor kinase CheA
VSSDEPITGPFAEFIDDYFVECEEHLAIARRSLLALEPFVERPHPDPTLLDELFRSFHSLKGLSAMVGVGAAEQLAHEMESYLSVLRRGGKHLSAQGLDILITGVKTLDQVVAARQGKGPPPDTSSLLAQLTALVETSASLRRPAPAATPGSDPSGLDAEREGHLKVALARGGRAWLFTFAPSPGLAERGVNVNTVRQRLQEVGELIHGAPLILAGGQVAFVFLVVSQASEAVFDTWQQDGLTYAPHEAGTTSAPGAPAPGNDLLHSKASPSNLPSVSTLAVSNLVRVDLGRLDDLMRMVGELVISRARLDDGLRRLSTAVPGHDLRGLQETNLALERQLRDLREGVMHVRMVPVREIFARMQFVVRDLTREHGKKAALELTGQDTEIDKLVVERMMEPLLHLVRNAVSHALELPEERAAQGKPSEGRIALRAHTAGETITIEVEDDGRGIDVPRVLARARAAGLAAAGAGDDPAALLDVLCAPGFSTRDEADRASGRGVGMAVVRTVVEELGGSLAIRTQVGRGTCFTVLLPLTLAIADALVIAVGSQRYVLPQVSVREVIQVEAHRVTQLENNEIVHYRGGVLPLLRLARVFRLQEEAGRDLYALVTGEGLNAIGIAVDRVLGLREIVVRPLSDPLVRVPGIAGATELGDGRVVLILDAAGLARTARRHDKRARAELPARPRAILLGDSPN